MNAKKAAPEIKSRMFSSADYSDEDNPFSRDLNYLLTLEIEKTELAIEEIKKLFLADSIKDLDSESEPLSKKLDVSLFLARKALTVLGFLISGAADQDNEGDTPELWSDDLKNMEILKGEEDYKKFKKAAEFIFAIKSDIKKKIQENKTVSGVLPMLKKASATVEIRAVQEKKFKFGEDIESYKTKIENVVPVVSINLLLDSGKNLWFQMGEKDLKRLMDVLSAIEKDMNELKKFTNLDG